LWRQKQAIPNPMLRTAGGSDAGINECQVTNESS